MFTKILRGLYTGIIYAAVFATFIFGIVLLIAAIFGDNSLTIRIFAIVTLIAFMWFGVSDELKGGDDLDEYGEDATKEFEA